MPRPALPPGTGRVMTPGEYARHSAAMTSTPTSQLTPTYLDTSGVGDKSMVEHLKETLTEVLKEKLGINDEVMMQQLGAHYGGPVVAAAPGQEEEAKEEKTAFDVKLESFDAAKKLKVIKEVRAITGLGLKEAKELVEKAPSEVKLGVSKEEAEEIQKKLEEVGGTIKVE